MSPAHGQRRLAVGDGFPQTGLSRKSGGVWIKNYCGQGANCSRDGLQEGFRLSPGCSWSAETTFLKSAAVVKKEIDFKCY
jgi:hypothetical protein